ncbi:hypothetical protein KJ680_14300, partial [bacterium]|nr:hypothetical protein [bacterium]
GEAELLFKHVIIEAKRGYSRYSMQDLLDVPDKSLGKNPVYEMCVKLSKSCQEQNKLGMLLWKRDRRELLIAVLGKILPCDLSIAMGKNLLVSCLGLPILVRRWSDFVFSVSADRLMSLLKPPVASSESTPSTP